MPSFAIGDWLSALQHSAMTPDETFAALRRQWDNKMLEELRQEAERRASGIAFDALRIGRKRILLVVCITGHELVERLARLLEFQEGTAKSEDWNTFTLSAFVARAFSGGKIIFEELRDEYGRRNALALSAADPDSITTLEQLFALSP